MLTRSKTLFSFIFVSTVMNSLLESARFTLWDGRGTGSLGLVLMEEERGEADDKKEGRTAKLLKVVKTWHQSKFF